MAIKESTLTKKDSQFVLPKYDVYFSKSLANRYKPIIYNNYWKYSGDPEGVYYRIVRRKNPEEYCIQYFYYWLKQECGPTSHRYDYEPVFVYLKPNLIRPTMIVNGGLGDLTCFFHKNEIRPRDGRRSFNTRRFNDIRLSPKPFYPYGENGNKKISGCFKKYPLKGNKDLKFDGLHPKFGIAVCSNVFSGSTKTLYGKKYNPPLKELTDKILDRWYFKHNTRRGDVPFGHDIANPFTHPYIKYSSAK